MTKPTGYKRGRPRKGEIRPLTPLMIRNRAYVQAQIDKDPVGWYARQAAYNAKWRALNPEKSKEQHRASKIRLQAWRQATSFTVAGSVGEAGNPLEVLVTNDRTADAGRQYIYSPEEDDQYDDYS